MAPCLRVIGMITCSSKENANSLMDRFMMVNGRMENLKVLALNFGLMGDATKDNGFLESQ